MQAVRAYYDGTAFIPVTPVSVKPNQSAIITILDDTEPNTADKPFEKFIGKLSPDSYSEIMEALSETQRIDHVEGLQLKESRSCE